MVMRSLFLLLVVSFLPHYAWAQDVPIAEIVDVVRRIGDRNLRTVSEAIEQAAELPYQPVFDAVEEAYHTEMRRVLEQQKNPNTFVMAAVFNTLVDLSAQSLIPRIEAIIADFEAKMSAYREKIGNEGFGYVEDALEGLRSDFRQTDREVLPTIDLDDVPTPEQTPDLANAMTTMVESLGAALPALVANAPGLVPNQPETNPPRTQPQMSLKDRLLSVPVDPQIKVSPGLIVVKGSVDLVRDSRNELRELGEHMPIIGREVESREVLNVLARLKGMNPALLGTAGSGKTAIAHHIDDLAAEGRIPSNLALDPIKELFVIETTPARIATLAKSNDPTSQAAAIEAYVEAVIAAQKFLGITLVIYLDEAHQLIDSQVEALKRYMDSRDGPRILFSSTAAEFKIRYKHNTAFLRRIKEVPVEELPF